MVRQPESLQNNDLRHLGVCLINPAILPDWFWQPTADRLRLRGFDCRIPQIQRGAQSRGVNANVDIIEATMQDCELLYLVALSRGKEYEERYMERLGKRGLLSRVVGRTVISSSGPRGLEAEDEAGQPLPRHNELHMSGITIDDDGLEVMDPDIAEITLLNGVRNQRLRTRILKQLVRDKPLTAEEITTVPRLGKQVVPLKWYRGRYDLVDNPQANEFVAREYFGVEVEVTDWGHIGPLSHTAQVVDMLTRDINDALRNRKASLRTSRARHFTNYPANDKADTTAYMLTRRIINEEYAVEPVNFNAEGLQRGERVIGRALTPEDVVTDIGSSTGRMIAEAAIFIGNKTRLIAVEPDASALAGYTLLPDALQKRLSYLRAVGEAIPLGDNSVQGATLHNVVFRSSDFQTMLSELVRIVKPGGFMAFSTNVEGHALKRHNFESQIAQVVIEMSGIKFTVPQPPAKGHYLGDLVKQLALHKGLEVIDELGVLQNTQAIITPGNRQETYLESLKYSAANTDTPAALRKLWRFIVDTMIKEQIQADMQQTLETHIAHGEIVTIPYFGDPIKRGMVMVRNHK